MMNKTYSELISLRTFQERFEYLRFKAFIGEETFGFNRYLNQALYQSKEWKEVRQKVILRDLGCDLAHEDYPIDGRAYIHHLNPITPKDIMERNPCIFDLSNLVCTTFDTHNAIHYGVEDILKPELIVRTRNDTCPWR